MRGAANYATQVMYAPMNAVMDRLVRNIAAFFIFAAGCTILLRIGHTCLN